MDSTKTTFLVKGIYVTDDAVVFDYEENKKRDDKIAKTAIIIGAFTIILVGLGILAIIIGIIQLRQSPEYRLNGHRRYLEQLSSETGKPIVYKNLPPEVANYGLPQTPEAKETPASEEPSEEPSEDQSLAGEGKKIGVFCHSCGKEIKSTDQFCPYCGKAV